MKLRIVSRMASVALALAGLSLLAPSTEACMGPCDCQIGRLGGLTCFPAGCNNVQAEEPIEVKFLSPTRVILRVPGYFTMNLLVHQECVVAMPSLPGLIAVRETVNFDSETDFPLSIVSFAPSDLPGPAVAKVAAGLGLDVGNSLPWYSFISTTEGSFEEGDPNHFVLELRLEPETDPYEFIEELRKHGALLTASSDAEGNPDGGHTFGRPFSGKSMRVTFPPMWGASREVSYRNGE